MGLSRSFEAQRVDHGIWEPTPDYKAKTQHAVSTLKLEPLHPQTRCKGNSLHSRAESSLQPGFGPRLKWLPERVMAYRVLGVLGLRVYGYNAIDTKS